MGLATVIYSRETTYFGFYRISGLAHIGSVIGTVTTYCISIRIHGYRDHLFSETPGWFYP